MQQMDRLKRKINLNVVFQEIWLNYALWIGFVLYATYRFSATSSKDFATYEDNYGDFSNGWTRLKRKQDKSDYEWNMLMYVYKSIVPWLIVHSITTYIIRSRKFTHKVIQLWYVIWSLCFLLMKFDWKSTIFLVTQPIIYQMINRSFKTCRTVLWFCNIVWIVAINLCKLNETFVWFDLKEIDVSVIVQTSYWISLRCLYFYTIKVKFQRSEKKDSCPRKVEETYNFLDCLAYCFYLPMLVTGPFVLYDDFKSTLRTDNVETIDKFTLLCFVVRLGRYVFWLYVVEYFLHYFYVNVYAFHPNKVVSMDSWSLYGYGYSMGQYFHLKYVIMYGISTTLSRFDGVLVPNLPKCIGRIHLYSDMWKYFDCGLYKFLLECIYKPTLRDRTSSINRIISCTLCFAYIYFWHGLQTYIFVWSTLNCFGVICEFVGKKLYAIRLRHLVVDEEDSECERRLIAFVTCPLLAISAMSNFYFFAGIDVGNVFFRRFFTDSIYRTLILLFALYNCCRVSSNIKSIERTTKRDQIMD